MPQGGLGSWEDYLQGARGALLIILRELGASTYFWEFREHCLKVKKKYQASVLFDSLKILWFSRLKIIYGFSFFYGWAI